MKRKKNSKVWDALTQKQSDYLIQAGWFDTAKYDNDVPVGGIAAVQNYGALINVTEKMRAFFRYEFGVNLRKDTKQIVIPATHFWENCKKENKEKWKKLCKYHWQKVFLGEITADTVAEELGSQVENDIRKQMSNGDYPPVTRLTLTNKLKQYKDQSTVGQLGQRFQTKEHKMLDDISHKVEKI